MSTHDPISDLITRIRNAQMRSKPKVSTPGSKMRANVLEVLKTEGGGATFRVDLPLLSTSASQHDPAAA